MTYVPSPTDTPFQRLGGEAPVRAIVEKFYDAMTTLEPELARLHPCDAEGRVDRESREKFALFFIGWLGGPQDYVEKYGHPRLRMRHAHVPVDEKMVEAWKRCMRHALEESGVAPDVREFLDGSLGQIAAFMKNRG